MKPAILFVALLFAVILIQLFNRTSGDPGADLVAGLARLEARTELLTKRLAQLEQAQQAAPTIDLSAPSTDPLAAATTATTAAFTAAATRADSGIAWRLGAGLQGDPLRVAAQTVDPRRRRIEVLLEIKAPLSDANAWPRQPGLQVPVILVARDNSGTIAVEQPLTLMRGSSQEPGAYLHLGAELSEQTADRVQVIELRWNR